MTTLELKLNLSDRLAREAQAAGLLTSTALAKLLRDAMRKQAAQTILAGAARATAAGGKPLTLDEVQEGVNAVRQQRRSKQQAAA
jgi:post-segregation antitoxin (ccd killing protein)